MRKLIKFNNWEQEFGFERASGNLYKTNLYKTFKNLYNYKDMDEFYMDMKSMHFIGILFYDDRYGIVRVSKRVRHELKKYGIEIKYEEDMNCICCHPTVRNFGIIIKPTDDKYLFLIGKDCIEHFLPYVLCEKCFNPILRKNSYDYLYCSDCSCSFCDLLFTNDKKECRICLPYKKDRNKIIRIKNKEFEKLKKQFENELNILREKDTKNRKEKILDDTLKHVQIGIIIPIETKDKLEQETESCKECDKVMKLGKYKTCFNHSNMKLCDICDSKYHNKCYDSCYNCKDKLSKIKKESKCLLL